VSRDSAETKCNQTITGPTYGADYILEILGQKWRALPNFLALRNRPFGLGKRVSLEYIEVSLGLAGMHVGGLVGWISKMKC
jgi:hypothetical protein